MKNKGVARVLLVLIFIGIGSQFGYIIRGRTRNQNRKEVIVDSLKTDSLIKIHR